jgi:NAD(P)-dependent dehydrogenase (short-subunit alcohol dehydrogenase family)
MNISANINWTTNNIPDLAGKVIIVTGANSGIGYEAAKELARKGAQTILACRSVDKAQRALNQIRVEIPNAKVEFLQLDLASQKSIHEFADAFKSKYDRLDVLVNNAGIMMVSYGLTEDGFERQFGTNHLGHFALTGLLINLLKNTPNSRVVNVSSNGHYQGHMDFNNLMFKNGKGYSRMGAYARTKLANLLFTYELQRRFEVMGINSIATAAHPGLTNTALADHFFGVKLLRPIFGPVLGRVLQDAAMGALPTLRAAVDPTARGGEYYGPDGPGQTSGYPIMVRSNQSSHNESDARQLWVTSEKLTGINFL